jgi:hypothetical protein
MRNVVPWKAVRIRKMKNDIRLGANAVPMEKARNSMEDIRKG